MPISEFADSWPDVLVRCAQKLEDVQQLLKLAVTREQRLLHTKTKYVPTVCAVPASTYSLQKLTLVLSRQCNHNHCAPVQDNGLIDSNLTLRTISAKIHATLHMSTAGV